MGDEWLRVNAAISFVLYVKLHCIVSVGVSSLSKLPCTISYRLRITGVHVAVISVCKGFIVVPLDDMGAAKCEESHGTVQAWPR